jgi:hypothetical protein
MKEKDSEYFYHATKDKYLDDIARKGLVPNTECNFEGKESRCEMKTYLARQPYVALGYGEQAALEDAWSCDEPYTDICYYDVVLLRINGQNIHDTEREYYVEGRRASEEFFTDEIISPTDIKFIANDEGWIPLESREKLVQDVSHGKFRQQNEDFGIRQFAYRCLVNQYISDPDDKVFDPDGFVDDEGMWESIGIRCDDEYPYWTIIEKQK